MKNSRRKTKSSRIPWTRRLTRACLKQLKDAKLQREYQEALAILERIPKEVLDAYTHMGTTERNHPMKQGL